MWLAISGYGCRSWRVVMVLKASEPLLKGCENMFFWHLQPVSMHFHFVFLAIVFAFGIYVLVHGQQLKSLHLDLTTTALALLLWIAIANYYYADVYDGDYATTMTTIPLYQLYDYTTRPWSRPWPRPLPLHRNCNFNFISLPYLSFRNNYNYQYHCNYNYIELQLHYIHYIYNSTTLGYGNYILNVFKYTDVWSIWTGIVDYLRERFTLARRAI